MGTKYERIARRLREAIEGGSYGQGDRLPAEVQLAEQYEVNRRTVRRALDVLEEEGRIDRQHGRGTFVKGAPADCDASNVVYVGRTAEDYFREFYWALSREAQSHNVALTCHANDEHDGHLDVTRHLRSLVTAADAVICDSQIWGQLAPVVPADVNVVQVTSFTGQDIQDIEGRPTYVLATDELRAAEMATQRLLDAGHSRIALVCVGWGDRTDEVRREVLPRNPACRGYRSVLRRVGIEDEAVVGVRPARSDEWQDVGETAIGRFLDSLDETPDGFVCEGDFRAAPLLRVLRRSGIDVPGDASVVGMANTPWCEMLDPRLTSVSLGQDQIARMAVMLTGESPPDYQPVMHVRPRLIERESAAPACQKTTENVTGKKDAQDAAVC